MNGFSSPLNPVQVALWVLFLMNSLMMPSYIVPKLPRLFKLLFLGTFAATWLLFVFFYIKAAHCDPGVKRALEALRYPRIITILNPSQPSCLSCKVNTVPGRSATSHCDSCKKCVAQRQFHSNVINNCVGERNNFYYWALVASFCVHNLTLLLFGVPTFSFSQGQGLARLYNIWHFATLLEITVMLLCLAHTVYKGLKSPPRAQSMSLESKVSAKDLSIIIETPSVI